MFNYLINWVKLVYENIPAFLRTPIRLARIFAALRPLKDLHSEFITFKDQSLYEASYNGGIICLETALNDRFDTLLRRIYIKSAFYAPTYIYGKSELKINKVLYSKWDALASYAANTYVWRAGNAYKSNASNTGADPLTSSSWAIQSKDSVPILRSHLDYNGVIAFYVFVPASLTFSPAEMRALIKKYILAGPGFQIITI